MTQLNKSVEAIVTKTGSELNKAKDKYTEKLKNKTTKKVEKSAEKLAEKATSTVNKKVETVTTTIDAKSEELSKMIKKTVDVDLEKPIMNFLDSSVENVVKSQLAPLGIKNLSDAEKVLQAESMFKSAYKALDMSALTKDYSKTAEERINSIVNGGIDSVSKLFGSNSVNKYLSNSKMAQIISKSITTEFCNAMKAIQDSKLMQSLTEYSKKITASVIAIQKSMQEKIKAGIGKVNTEVAKLKTAVKDKLEMFNKKKAEYMAKLNEQITTLKKKINEYMKKISTMLVNEIKKVLSNIGSGIKSAISGIKL